MTTEVLPPVLAILGSAEDGTVRLSEELDTQGEAQVSEIISLVLVSQRNTQYCTLKVTELLPVSIPQLRAGNMCVGIPYTLFLTPNDCGRRGKEKGKEAYLDGVEDGIECYVALGTGSVAGDAHAGHLALDGRVPLEAAVLWTPGGVPWLRQHECHGLQIDTAHEGGYTGTVPVCGHMAT